MLVNFNTSSLGLDSEVYLHDVYVRTTGVVRDNW